MNQIKHKNRSKHFGLIVGSILVVILVIVLGVVLFDQYTLVDTAASLPYTGTATTTNDTSLTQISTASQPPAPSSSVVVATSTSFKAYFDPQSGPVGTVVTIHGFGFGAANTVTLNGLTSGSLKNIPGSMAGHLLTFTIPSDLGPNCNPDQACPQFMMIVSPNAYKVSVITGSTTQDFGTFTVTGKALVP